MSNRFLQLPFVFDPDQLRQDLGYCQSRSWTNHFNAADYAGSWTSLSLRSASGLETDILAHDQPNGYRDTAVLAKCPYFRAVLSRFEADLQAVRLLSLAPGSVIREHTDQHLSYEYGCFRLHIPLQTGSDVQFRVDGTDLLMQPGECWYANFNLPHSVRNNGSTDRIHLVIDGLRNDWSDGLFGRAGYDAEAERRARNPSTATKQQMITELERMDSDTARQLISTLRREIDQIEQAA